MFRYQTQKNQTLKQHVRWGLEVSLQLDSDLLNSVEFKNEQKQNYALQSCAQPCSVLCHYENIYILHLMFIIRCKHVWNTVVKVRGSWEWAVFVSLQLTREYFSRELKRHYQGHNNTDVFTSTWNAIMTTVKMPFSNTSLFAFSSLIKCGRNNIHQSPSPNVQSAVPSHYASLYSLIAVV